MKRYKIDMKWTDYDAAEIEASEDPEGVWVEYKDAKAEIERISEIYERRIRELKKGNWVKRRIKEAGWEDKEVYRVIGNEGHHLITFTDGACLIRGDIIDGKWSRENE